MSTALALIDEAIQNGSIVTPDFRALDFTIEVPEPNRIELHNEAIFSDWNQESCRQFIELSLGIKEVEEVEIDPFRSTAIVILKRVTEPTRLLRKVAAIYKGTRKPDLYPSLSEEMLRALPASLPRLRVFRYGQVLSTWEIRLDLPGWVRLRNACILNKPHLVKYLERELMGLMGVEHYKFHARAGSVTIEYQPTIVHKQQIVSHLDGAISRAPDREKRALQDFDFTISSAALMLSGVATFFVPILLPLGTLVMLYTAIPSFERAWRVIRREKRLGVDVLDAIIFTACLFTGEIFAGSMTAWFLSVGRKLLKHTREQSAKVLLHAFGKQPTLARILKSDGSEVETPLEKIKRGDLIVVHTGEVVPVDGIIKEGDAILDQHALTGESTPAEKSPGDRVYAATVMLAGKIIVTVEEAGKDTASSKISEVLQNTVAYKLKAQSRGEELADRVVVPALAVSSVAGALYGTSAALAVVYSDLGTGIRMAAPLGMLTSITLCAKNGILIKDGRALELMRQVDTVLFDKTGTLTREKPEVGEIICVDDFTEEEIITMAAGAEQKFTHPIARAILEEFSKLKRPMPVLDESNYKVGYGITVRIGRELVRVGSRRFMDMQKISIPQSIEKQFSAFHGMGHSFVCVAVGKHLAGVIELRASHRPEVDDVVSGLRARGVKHMAIISGDHKEPTKRLAEQLGMDRYFAEVLPADKARYVELLQAEGRTVCFVGDGINDSIALKKANVSISLRGASTIATDTAQIVFMEESLGKICDLKDISLGLERNVRQSWNLILVPNTFCVFGVFFLGFNIWHSVVFNNASALMALANGLLPLRKAAQITDARQARQSVAAAQTLFSKR